MSNRLIGPLIIVGDTMPHASAPRAPHGDVWTPPVPKAERLRKESPPALLAELVPALTALGLAVASLLSSPGAGLAQVVDDKLWFADGRVDALVRTPQTIYIGGTFTRIGPNTGGFVPVDGSSASLPASFPKVAGVVEAIASDGTGGWYVGGFFTAVGGLARSNLAHVASDMTVLDWNPIANDHVVALAVGGSAVYVGGYFTLVNREARNYIAALDATTGATTTWNPIADARVFALAVSGTTLYVGGSFTTIGGQARSGIAALDAATGAVTAWEPGAGFGGSSVRALAVSGSTIYAGGLFTSIGGQGRSYIAALDSTTGSATSWNPNADSYVYALAVAGSTIYAGGEFTSIGGQARNHIAALDVSTGTATAWDPDADAPIRSLAVSGSTVYAGGQFTTISGKARNRIAALDANGAATPWDPNANDWVMALAVNGSTVAVGGNFASLGGRERNNIAALDATTGAATDWNPSANSAVSALAVSGSAIYAGGQFTSIGGMARNRIASLDATNGVANAWDPGANGTVSALAVSGSTVYAGGQFTTIGGIVRNRIAALDAVTGATSAWNPNADDGVQTLAVSGVTVYAGGRFTSIGGQARNRVAALDAGTGTANPWDPNASDGVLALAVSGSTVYAGGQFTSIGGQVRNGIAALDATTGLATSWAPDARYGVSALAVRGSTVYAGGLFTSIGGQGREGVAAVDSATGVVLAWSPIANGAVFSLAAGGGALYVGGSFSVDGHDNLAVFDNVRMMGLLVPPPALAATVGDTAFADFSIQNTGLETLTISSFDTPSAAISLSPRVPFKLAPGANEQLTLQFGPLAPSVLDSGEIRLFGDDPSDPPLRVSVSFEARGLTAQTRALVTADRAPLGQAVTILVVPDAGHHIEGGTLYFRSAGEADFGQVALALSAGALVGIIPGSSVRESGVEFYVQLENSGIIATDPPLAPQDLFTLAVAAPSGISSIAQPDGSGEFPTDRPTPVIISLPAGSAFNQGTLHFRPGGAAVYDTSSLRTAEVAPGLFAPADTIPANAVGPRGVEYWVSVNTLTRGLTDPSQDPAGHPHLLRTVVSSLLEGTTHAGGRYRLFSVPLDFGPRAPNVSALLDEFDAYDPARWRAFRYLPELGATLELSPVDTTGRFRPVPGRAFWLISRAVHRINTAPLPGLSTSTGADFAIVVASGWNQIADPFDFPVAWSAIRKPAAVGLPVAFDPALGRIGDYAVAPPQVLQPFEGYFVKNSAAEPETIWVPPIEASTSAPHAARVNADGASPSDDGWHILLHAETEHAVDGSNLMGVAAAAKDGLDALDLPKPPAAPGEWVQLGFRLPPEAAIPDLYRCDLRAPGAEGNTWEIELRSSTLGEPVALRAVAEHALPDGVRVRLIDRELGSTVDMRRTDGSLDGYRLLSYGPNRAYCLTLLVGSEAFVSHPRGADLLTPGRVTMDQAVPNPSRAPMRIRFGLPQAQAVTLEIYNVAGQRVATLLDRASQSAGYHALLWDGCGHGGAPAPSGIYFCRLVSAERVLTRRLVRLN